MYLHNNKELFQALIKEVSEENNIDEVFVEKDYFVTLILKRLTEKEPLLIFKGGTCLSKCYKIIDRFSEDLDITLEKLSDSPRKKMKRHILGVIEEFDLKLLNPEAVKSGRKHNNYVLEYPSFYKGLVPPEIQVETMFFVETFPTERMGASSIIGEYLNNNGDNDLIEKYNLESFTVKTQCLERTFVDKVFALGTRYLKDETERQSRHLYDLHKILPHIKINKDLLDLFDEVRMNWREDNRDNDQIAAEMVDDLPELLKEVIHEEIYRLDYEKYTNVLLYEDVNYDDAIRTFKKIVSELEGGMEM